MPASTKLSRRENLASELSRLMPSRVAEKVVERLTNEVSTKAKRVMLYDMGAKERALILFPLEELKAAGVDVPEMGKDAVFVSTGPGNGELINKNKENVAFRFRGNEIVCSVKGSAPIKLGLKRGKRVAEYM